MSTAKNRSFSEPTSLTYDEIKHLFQSYICDISHTIFTDPVTVVESGITYDRKYFSNHSIKFDPKTRCIISNGHNIKTNFTIKNALEIQCKVLSRFILRDEIILKCMQNDDVEMFEIILAVLQYNPGELKKVPLYIIESGKAEDLQPSEVKSMWTKSNLLCMAMAYDASTLAELIFDSDLPIEIDIESLSQNVFLYLNEHHKISILEWAFKLEPNLLKHLDSACILKHLPKLIKVKNIDKNMLLSLQEMAKEETRFVSTDLKQSENKSYILS